MALEFDTAVARVRAEDEAPEEQPSVSFFINERDPDTDEIIDRVELTAFDPGEGQVIVLMTDVMGRRATPEEKMAGIIDFLTDILDEPSKRYVVKRLLDPADPFGLTNIEDILYGLVEGWGGRPTKQPSDFAPSRKTGGPRSTPRTSKSTSSRSRSTASSTRSTRSTSKASSTR